MSNCFKLLNSKKLPLFSKLEYIVVDGFPIKLFFKLVFLRSIRREFKVFYLPMRSHMYFYFMKRIPFLRNISIENFLILIIQRINPKIKIVNFDLGSFPLAMDLAGNIGVQLTEELHREWLEKYPLHRKFFKRVFFNDSDIFFAHKKYIGKIVEDTLYKLFAAISFCKGRPATSIFFNKENIFFIDSAFNRGLIKQSFQSKEVCVLISSFFSTINYIWIACLFNIFSVGSLLIRPLFGKVSIVGKQAKVAASLAIQNIYGTRRNRYKDFSPGAYQWGDIAFLIDDEIFQVDDLVILGFRLTKSGEIRFINDYKKAGLNVSDVSKAKIPLKAYFKLVRDILPFSFCLAVSSLNSISKTLLALVMTPLLQSALFLARVCEEVSFKVYLDIEEYSYIPFVKKVVFKHYGAHTVFLPHGVFQYTSYVKAYLAYSLMFTPGEHFPLSFGKHWKQDMLISLVGNMKNDAAIVYGKSEFQFSSLGFEDIIRGLRKNNKAIVSFLPGSVMPSKALKERYRRFAKLATLAIERFPNLVIIIKVKNKAQGRFFRTGYCQEIFKLHLDKGRIVIIDCSDQISCSVQSVALASDACVVVSGYNSTVSTAWAEALMLNRPSFSFDPADSGVTTPLLEEFYGKLIFRTEEEILNVLERVIVKKDWEMPCWDMAKRYFDPYCDGKTLPRMRKELKNFISDPKLFLQQHQTVEQFLQNSSLSKSKEREAARV